MRTIGIRVEPKKVTFVIYDADAGEVINIEGIKIPKALDVPEALKYIRSNLLDVIVEYEVQRAGIRVTEPSAQKPNILRIQIEGVIQEALASSDVEAYFRGQISSLSSRLNIKRKDLKKYLEGELVLRNIEGWSDLSTVEREAVCTAIGACDA
ncbi:hypothetical protein [Marinobacter sp. LV10MA510-1]|uniref:hypothetical protein n=1 Tax=Marinobacter sp. LV10MA510-1 TaxID=1415567 RepID=UPI000BF63122|nr:hypothetical protein [Marinobacter sp. LV10MA510-1]PFG11405.1 hypothetical protein ATI45_3918 [Marinobacter sp. LV10MA510-1]